MSNYKKQVKTFKGKVTIQDIQEEFDRIIGIYNEETDKWEGGLNGQIEFINSLDELQNLEFYKGSTNLPSSEYTLTLGALKQILAVYNNRVINTTCVKDPKDSTKMIVFPGLHISSADGIKQIGNKVVEKTANAIDLYVNPTSNSLSFTEQEGYTHVTELDWVRDEYVLNTTQDNLFVNPNISPKIQMDATNLNQKSTYDLPDDTSAFFLPCMNYTFNGNGLAQSVILIDNKEILNSRDRGNGAGKRKAGAMFVYAPIFIPKGCKSKVTYTGPKPKWKSLTFKLEEQTE